ncbi:uncharacterized protein HMPREF1541_09224 [Cyphellophora europaea CBS 101466]|uniref:Zn(2)-C6 fungal-type domain-containing protein n=1 Tax=Cyphellophora europaea (strain CBS 101466) TaxID=1220924 RepID=W2SBL6_CYPE1|nr:uncharacterized protein HMPREF1541_09224 [Cyphellophora europaea CBS 101466]ETN45393.1 hypothetical protein HMPREF1541_09224 [Cyphellophora europaea CBS 101466]
MPFEMDRSFPQILNPSSSSVAPNGPKASLEAARQPIDLSVTDSSQAPDADSSRKRPASRIKSSYPRKRAIQACQKCRVRRTKCDNLRPTCSSCLDLGVECNYSEGDPSSYDAASLAILEKLSTIEQLLKPDDRPPAPPPRAASTRSSDLAESPVSHVKSLSSPSLERTKEAAPYHMSIERMLAWPVFQDLDPCLDLRCLLNASNDSQSQATLAATMAATKFDPNWDDELVKNFMDQVYIFNPIVEEAKIQKYVRDARFNGIGNDGPACLLLLILALGALSGSSPPRPPADASESRQQPYFKRAESYYAAAQQRMGMLLSQSGIVEAQCFFYAGVYLMSTIRPLEGWKMFVQALASCQAFYGGIEMTSRDNDRDKRLRESIYWTCFKSELEARLELNVTDASVWDLRYPAFFPSPPNELRSRSQTEIVWYYFLAEIALRRLANRILNYIYSTKPFESGSARAIDMAEQIPAFEQQAADWVRSLPPSLSLDKVGQRSPGESDLHQTLRFILEGELLDCYEMMYWPFIASAINASPEANHAINKEFTRKALDVAVQRIEKNEPGFYYRHHGTWAMLRSCTRSGLVLLAASRSSTVRHLLPTSWRHAVSKIVDMLRFWRWESEDVADRLILIETMLQGT